MDFEMSGLAEIGILALGTRLRVLSEQMMATVKAFYDQYGLDFEPRWFPLFQLVQRQPGLHVAALAAEIGVSHTAIHALAKPLAEAGLIALTPAPDDARARQVRLTREGEVLFDRMRPAWAALARALDSALPDGGVAEILGALDRLDRVIADVAIPRGLRDALSRETIAGALQIKPYDPANPDHKRSFAALNIEWLQRYFTVEPVDWQMFEDPIATIVAPGGEIVVAELDGVVVGTGALIKRSDEIFELAKMAVSMVYQGKGIGAKIVEVLVASAKARGLAKLYLVSSTRLPQAVPLYRKLGFVDTELPLHQVYKRSDISLELDLRG
jgi:DNA-binding MarR family transcriptional regulator/GNAT superfamily N-acetyltransferase